MSSPLLAEQMFWLAFRPAAQSRSQRSRSAKSRADLQLKRSVKWLRNRWRPSEFDLDRRAFLKPLPAGLKPEGSGSLAAGSPADA
jgi:hypothetical protein